LGWLGAQRLVYVDRFPPTKTKTVLKIMLIYADGHSWHPTIIHKEAYLWISQGHSLRSADVVGPRGYGDL